MSSLELAPVRLCGCQLKPRNGAMCCSFVLSWYVRDLLPESTVQFLAHIYTQKHTSLRVIFR